ncbi:SDR family oxidoreductase [Candidatus Collierbacteria bacterium]|nr:SDR family oxidoreductase [Candidatus Collierbacteria bacterium]
MSILILGANGMLGSAFVAKRSLLEKFFSPIFFAYHSKPKKSREKNICSVMFDATDPLSLQILLSEINPEIIVNCAAMTIVEDCEENPDLAYKINAEFPGILAEWTAKHGKKLIHYSTDAVFDGKNPPVDGYTEIDKVHPLNLYAKSKLKGEQLVLKIDPNALVLRTNIIGIRGRKPYPLVEWILRTLAAGRKVTSFTDVVFAPLFIEDIVKLTIEALRENLYGLYNLNAKNRISKYRFAKLLAKEFGYDSNLVLPVKSGLVLSIPRPQKTYLNSLVFARKIKISLPMVNQGVTHLHQSIKSDKFRL